MIGFKAFYSASATLNGIEIAHMIRKEQFDANALTHFSSSTSSQHKSVQRQPTLDHVGNLRQNPVLYRFQKLTKLG